MPGQPLVDERVVRVHQVEHVAIFAHDAVEQQLRLALEGLPQVVVEVGIHEHVGIPVSQLAQEQPLSREIADQRPRARILQHPPDLLLEHRGILELALLGGLQELLVGNAAPQEERQARRQLEVADAIRGARGNVRRIALEPEHEVRVRQNPAQRHLDALVEVPALAAGAVEGQQRRDVGVGHRTPIRAARQRRNDLLRARGFRFVGR